MLTISAEVGTLLSNKCNSLQQKVVEMKIKQITRLTVAATLLDFAAGVDVLSGIFGAMLTDLFYYSHLLLVLGTIAVFGSLIILVIYSFITIKIRKLQFAHNTLSPEE